MYNRYIPSADGTYRRRVVTSAPKEQPPKQEPPAPQPMQKPFLPQLDTGDILVLLILLLIMSEGEEADPLSILITLAAFLLMQ